MSNTGSKGFSLAGVFHALQKAGGNNWHGVNDIQKRFLNEHSDAFDGLELLKSYLQSMQTSDPAELQNWFAQNGAPEMNFDFGGTAIGSIFNLKVNWLIHGKKQENIFMDAAGAYCNIVKLETGFHCEKIEGYPFPLFTLETQNNEWEVCLLETNEIPKTDLEVLETAKELLSKAQPVYRANIDDLSFPIANLTHEVDLSFLLGLWSDANFSVDVIKGLLKMRLDEIGAEASAFTAIDCLGEHRSYKIKRAFYVIFKHYELDFLPFVTIIHPNDWERGSQN